MGTDEIGEQPNQCNNKDVLVQNEQMRNLDDGIKGSHI
jgi:hypothetical protein